MEGVRKILTSMARSSRWGYVAFVMMLISGCSGDTTGPKTPVLKDFKVEPADSNYTRQKNAYFYVRITARDEENRTMTSYIGSAIISSNGPIVLPAGDTTDTFEDGWTTHYVIFSDTGQFTITALQTGGTHRGTSAPFRVLPPPIRAEAGPAAPRTEAGSVQRQ